MVAQGDLCDLDDRDLIYFTDDDDWVIPDLFAVLRSHDIQDGFLWSSIRVGPGPAVVEKRAFSNEFYTNNYCVSGRAVRRLGLDAVFEHYGAQKAAELGAFILAKLELYLSCANKHPCCTVNILHDPGFDIRLDTPKFLEQLSNAVLDEQTSWLGPYINDLRKIVSIAVPSKSTQNVDNRSKI